MIVAQVIDAVIATRLTRGPGASPPNDAAVSTAVPALRIAGTVGERLVHVGQQGCGREPRPIRDRDEARGEILRLCQRRHESA